MVSTFMAHDLLWGMTPGQLPADAPAWAVESLGAGQPVVVRRAVLEAGQVAVGVRGRLREQRYASSMAIASVSRRVQPEQLCHVDIDRDLPVIRALKQLRPLLDDCGWTWGVSGSAGFELASGFSALHEGSDLDLILRTPQPLARTQARELMMLLDASACVVDMQLQTPFGAVALREWAGSSNRVLLKNATQACLVIDPWNPQEQAA
ncbi:malonate decarboxylase holo-ACP synthase [Pseudomonas sp. G(2018)]|uniref:malonate decarboxylase holo-ACP synthase n=1 Tax=Pseudomonas sp. G(2018) TaxID=2502242 RepID=UPI0010F7BF71|nr:malonate decarboxylase holo-ACP synthase [Pseudomonas sp. G(2018)]